jgi:hypothetical protein
VIYYLQVKKGGTKYEITCLLTDRVPRVYIENGAVVAIDIPRMRYSEAK